MCSRKSATLASPCRSCRPASATWNTTKVTVMQTTPSSRSTQNQIGRRALPAASRAQVTSTMMFDWIVKKQNMLTIRPARLSKKPLCNRAVATSWTTSPIATTTAVPANHSRPSRGLTTARA